MASFKLENVQGITLNGVRYVPKHITYKLYSSESTSHDIWIWARATNQAGHSLVFDCASLQLPNASYQMLPNWNVGTNYQTYYAPYLAAGTFDYFANGYPVGT